MTKPWIPASAFCLAALGAGVNLIGLSETISPKGDVAGLNAHETHAAASLLGQFRSTVSGNLWLRADLYLHNGVQMRPLTEAEIRLGHRGSHSADGLDDQIHDGGKITTVIPGSREDFRGVLGDVERATKAYRDMTTHDHNNPRQTLPLFRLMTWADPRFVQGWTSGAHIMAMENTERAARQAVEFLGQGLDSNPESPSLNNQLGYTYVVKLKDFRRGIIAFQRAIDGARGIAVEKLTQDDQEALVAAYRWLALCYRNLGKQVEMRNVVQDGLARFPQDVPLSRIGAPQQTGPSPTWGVVEPKEENEDLDHDHGHDHDHYH